MLDASPLSIESRIHEWFTYHKPTDEQLPRYLAIREAAKQFALVVADNTISCADQTVALRKIREAVMVANQSIACNGI